MLQRTSVLQPPRLIFSKMAQFVASMAMPKAGYAIIDGPSDIIAQAQGPGAVLPPLPGQPACPGGQLGIPPYCVPITSLKCPTGTTGTFPLCQPVPAPAPNQPPVTPQKAGFDLTPIALGLGIAAVLGLAVFGGRRR
jgi:hypothetical protein